MPLIISAPPPRQGWLQILVKTAKDKLAALTAAIEKWEGMAERKPEPKKTTAKKAEPEKQ
jgi:hypothetical protein